MPIKDPVIESYVRTTATPAGQRADPYYLERIAVAPAIKDATTHYNAERYQDALTQYNSAAGGTASDAQLRVLNGIYLSSAKLGRTAEAEQAFGKIVAYGIAQQQLGVKFLFNPGGTAFWSDAKVSGPYPMWLREIAKASADAKVCMDIVGHTSRTGSAAFNDTLSVQRARYIRQRLIGEAMRAGRAHQAQRQGLSREHHRQRHRRRGRCAGPPGRVQDRGLRLSAAVFMREGLACAEWPCAAAPAEPRGAQAT